MRNEYDFSRGKRGRVLPSTGKTRITIMLDDEVISHFRTRAEALGIGYQTLINAALKEVSGRVGQGDEPLTTSKLRQILREELSDARSRRSHGAKGTEV